MITDKKAKIIARAIMNCGWAIGESYAIRNVYNSDLKPFYKWNLIVALALGLPSSIKKGLDSIDELSELVDEMSPEEEVSTEES